MDEDTIVEHVVEEMSTRFADAAEYHTRVVYDEAPKLAKSTSRRGAGDLAKSIRYVLMPNGWKVVVDEFYSAFQEFGTVKQRRNPFLLRGTLKALPGIIDILEGNGQ